MPDTGGQEKTEQPTGKRLEESREKGQVGKSMEINSLAIFATGLLLLYMTKFYIGDNLSKLSITIFSSLDSIDINIQMLRLFAIKGISFFVLTLAPVFFGLVIIALAAGYGQVGFKITPKALAPKFSKLNPIKGIKNTLFSSRSIVELSKSIIKLVIIGLFTYYILSDAIMNSVGLVDYSINEIVLFMVETTIDFLWKVAIVFALLAGADFAYQKFKHKKDLMMTKEEVKEENKQTEGDPHVKSHIKGKQIAMARSRMMEEIPTADVVITNPTHFAVAIKYEMGNSSAPKVIAKGADLVAQRIKKLAAENDVPLHEDVQLARALYKNCEIGDEIPENLYKAVAQILAYIFQLKNKTGKKSIV